MSLLDTETETETETETIATPPPFLYKYLAAARLDDVLATGTVRFTHLTKTNDPFEVRRTFREFAGPRFIGSMLERMEEKLVAKNIDDLIRERMIKEGLSGVPMRKAKRLLSKAHGRPIEEVLRDAFTSMIVKFADHMNHDDQIEWFLAEYGAGLLCFSVTETFQNAVMWSQYAENNAGFVVEFVSNHRWFSRADERARTRLQKIVYLDGELQEPLEDPQGAFSSKTVNWAHEKEWRLYCGMDAIEKTVGLSSDPIHLISFPPDAVSGIILGPRVAESIIVRAKEIHAARYPHARLSQAIPRPFGATYELVQV